MNYCDNIFHYKRRPTREVMVGAVGVGGSNPIRIQSMTISDTMNTEASVKEVMQLAEAGCEIVRLTAPSIKEAENLKNIKAALLQHGATVPLVADIHFTPNAALIAAEYVEKVRINPGNYADKKKFAVMEYSDEQYEQELLRIEEKFKPLVLKCKQFGRAIRIGTNHGSLSDRIMNRFGDTAEGMVESALEFVRICQKYDFHDIILSMKSSNPQVAIQAYRLLAAKADDMRMDYPFHLGVTEAGDGAEGRIKSAVGIGGLLLDGIGDTIRVSLTEDAVHEVPVAFKLAKPFNRLIKNAGNDLPQIRIEQNSNPLKSFQPFEYRRRETVSSMHVSYTLGNGQIPRVELALQASLREPNYVMEEILELVGSPANPLNVISSSNEENTLECETLHIKVRRREEFECLKRVHENLIAAERYLPFAVDVTDYADDLSDIAKLAERLVFSVGDETSPVLIAEVLRTAVIWAKPVEWRLTTLNLRAFQSIFSEAEKADYWNFLFSLAGFRDIVYAYRYLAALLDGMGATFPLLLRFQEEKDFETFVLQSASQIGSLLCDGIGDAVCLDSRLPTADLLNLSYNILQATRLRISKTDYISCPSCGRTLFNLQTTTERIKSKTDHLTGVKIAIMGCIVNGPGEMADADFGYVGAGPGKVNLFVGKECVERNIPESEADGRLIELIKKHDMWVEP